MSQNHPRIAIIDDDLNYCRSVSLLLQVTGLTVHEASTPQELFDILHSHSVDLILSDVDMPLMTGFELTQQVRDTKHWQHIPVLLMTGDYTHERAQYALQVGAVELIQKTPDRTVLRAALDRHVPKQP
jgi:PleD family two-component response regulator